MKLLARSLKRTPIFAELDLDQVEEILTGSRICYAVAGSVIKAPENAVKHHLLVLDGNIKSNNHFLFYGNEMQYCWQLQSDLSERRFAVLSSATRAINAMATCDTRYIFIDGDQVEELARSSTAKKPYLYSGDSLGMTA